MLKTGSTVGSYYAMCERVHEALGKKTEHLKEGSILLELYSLLGTRIVSLGELEVGRKQLEKHPAKQKQSELKKLEGFRQLFADGLLAFASREKNIELLVRAQEFSKKGNFRRDRDVKINFATLMADVRANAESLAPFNVTAKDIADANVLAENLSGVVNQTAMAIGQRKAKTASRDEIIGELRQLFKTQLDPAVRSLKDPDFIALYSSLRRLRYSPTTHSGDSSDALTPSQEISSPERKDAVASPEVKMEEIVLESVPVAERPSKKNAKTSDAEWVGLNGH